MRLMSALERKMLSLSSTKPARCAARHRHPQSLEVMSLVVNSFLQCQHVRLYLTRWDLKTSSLGRIDYERKLSAFVRCGWFGERAGYADRPFGLRRRP